MSEPGGGRSAARWLATGVGLAAGAYLGYAGWAWSRYGRPRRARGDSDALLDRFLPDYDIRERHEVAVAAPADIALAAAKDADLLGSPFVRAIVRARELALGARSGPRRPQGLLAETEALGWGRLAEDSGREIVMGAVTQPWEAEVIFRPLPPAEFAAFAEPGFVKIAWTLRADPAGLQGSRFVTETRAVATDETARRRFRAYWAFASPGIVLIRWLALPRVKAEAERRAAAAQGGLIPAAS